MGWPNGNGRSNGNGRGPVQTAPTRPPEREIAPRYPIPDPPDEEEDFDEGEEDGDPEDGELAGARTGTATAPESGLPPIFPRVSNEQLRWHLRRTAHMTALHAVRVPVYLLRTLRWAPIGIGRATVKLWRWETDKLGRDHLDWAPSSEEYLKLKKEHRQTVHDHTLPTVLAGCVIAAALMIGYYNWPIHTLTIIGGVVWLAGWYGAPKGSIIEHIEPARVELRRWDTWVIREAFEAAGLSKADKEGLEPEWSKRITFVNDPRRDGPGTSVTIDLAKSDTPAKVMGKKAQLASGLSVTRMQIEVTPDEESERRIELFIHDKDPTREPAPLTPLAEAAKWDFWEPVPFGLTTRGDPTFIDMLWGNLLVGSMPRVGKSFAARQIACAAALDPYVRLIVFNGRPDGAWGMFEQVAHRYGKGERDEVVDLLIASLEECVEQYERRSERLAGSKITKEMTRDRALDMPLTLIVVDEFHLYLKNKRQYKGRQTCGQRVLELLEYLVKVGGATGFMTILATQKPDTTISKDITAMRDNMNLAYALAVKTREAGKAILGEISPGLNPFQFFKKHIGVGVLIGGQDESGEVDEVGRIVRTYWCDDPDAEEILDRSRKLRVKLGMLSGHAAGDKPVEGTPDKLLDHILELTGPDEDRLTPKVVLDRLTAEHPDTYSGWTVDTLRSHLRDVGVSTSHQIHRITENGERENLRGIDLDEVKDALARKLAGAGSNGSNGNNDH